MDVAALLAVMASDGDDPDDAAQSEAAAQLLEMMAGFFRCLPDLSAFDGGDGGAAGLADDGLGLDGYCPGYSLSDQFEGATRVVLGEAVEGVLEPMRDLGYFVFAAEEDELYELAVDLVTLSDSVLAVCGADGWQLDFNDDRGDGSRASALCGAHRSPGTSTRGTRTISCGWGVMGRVHTR